MKKEVRRAAERWFEAGILDPQTMKRIEEYESARGDSAPDYLRIVLTVAGGGMVALGLVLLVANNWELLPKWQQAGLAVLLLVMAQIFAAFVHLRKNGNRSMHELSAGVLFITFGAAMVIVSRVYQMDGSLVGLLQIWALLGLPVVYLMRSYVASVLYLIMISVLSFNLAVSGTAYNGEIWRLAGLFVLWLPFYWLMYQSKPWSAVTRLHHLLVPVSFLCLLPALYSYGIGLLPAYLTAGLLFTGIGLTTKVDPRPGLNNGYVFTGLLATSFVLWIMSMGYVWSDINTTKLLYSGDVILTSIMMVAVIALGLRNKNVADRLKWIWLFVIPTIAVFIFAMQYYGYGGAVIISNGMMLILALLLISEGNRKLKLGYLNLGLLVLSVQILSRFFTSDWPLWIRGLGFVMVGLMFIIANRSLMKTRKTTDSPKFRFGGDIV